MKAEGCLSKNPCAGSYMTCVHCSEGRENARIERAEKADRRLQAYRYCSAIFMILGHATYCQNAECVAGL